MSLQNNNFITIVGKNKNKTLISSKFWNDIRTDLRTFLIWSLDFSLADCWRTLMCIKKNKPEAPQPRAAYGSLHPQDESARVVMRKAAFVIYGEIPAECDALKSLNLSVEWANVYSCFIFHFCFTSELHLTTHFYTITCWNPL